MGKVTPTQRTLRLLKQEGVIAGIVEKFNRFGGPHGIRQDLFGFIDLIAMDPEKGIVGIQCTSRSGHTNHRKKILDSELAIEWLKSGGTIELWSWGKHKVKRGGKLEVWKPKIETIQLSDFT